MKLTSLAVAASAAFAALAAVAPVVAQAAECCAPTTADWPYVNGNLGGQAYTSLTQVNKQNIRSLGPAWVTHTAAEPVTQPVAGPGGTQTAQQTTPIVVVSESSGRISGLPPVVRPAM